MTDVHRLPDERHVMREAADWIARLNADDATNDDHVRFQAWRSAHPAHARAFDELAGTFGRFTAVQPLVRAVAFAQSMNEAASAVTTPVERASRRRMAWATAAALVLIVALGWFAYLRVNPVSTYSTAIGEHATVSLPDGSALELNSASSARVDYSAKHRVIHLERGEGFFKVAHDPQRPFWVVGGGAWVRAVGTAFNVDMRSTGMRVTVSEGAVNVGAVDSLLQHIPFTDAALTNAPVISVLTAGEEADLRGSAAATRQLTPTQLSRSTAWREGILYFEDQPMSDVIEELRRYTPIELVVTDEGLRKMRIGGTFQANPQGTEALLTMLEQGLGLKVRRHPGRVVIEPAETTTR